MVNTIQLLRDMIAIPSVNPMSTNSGAPVERAMGNFMETMLTRAGIDCERQQVAEGRDIVIDVCRRENPKVEFKQFAAGGLTASRAQKRFYQDVLAWKPDKVLLVVMTRTDEDYEALKQMGQGFHAAGIKTYTFDEVQDPAAVKPGTVERARKAAEDSGIEVIEVGELLTNAPE